MPEPLDDTELDRLMADTRALIDALRTGEADAAPYGEGTSEDGRVRVTVGRGAVESIRLDPRLLRLPPDEVAELVLGAVNAAIGQARGAHGAPDVPDLAAMSQMLRQARDEALFQMDTIARGIASAMAELHGRTRVEGAADTRSLGLDQLLELTQAYLDVAAEGQERPIEPPRGEGLALDGQVRALAADGRLDALEIGAKAMSAGTHELAGHLRTAVNEAFADLRAQRAESEAAAGLHREDLDRRARQLQDLSLDQMHRATRALRDIMSSVRGPD
ncbi:YbaB/EbfC family nucleoid-associated protein [Nonomuraea sp. NPDC050547]|uniref:YbaB/EbfC family nucleoid-associated protein n=1 Tax=unclassified Nonomuraea TaxID=2593643 RepID=UPI0037BB6105